jgi:dTDP-4-amino-4,6-dideoxygalactose transaminase
VRHYYLARTAICQGLHAYGLAPGAVALMPSYHHGVEVEAVRAAGLEVDFYPVSRRLEVDPASVRARIDRRTAVLYLTHFAGFPGPAAALRALADEHGLVLVEDCALALGSRDGHGQPLGATGDLAVFCLYKSVPVPHGGVLWWRQAAPFPPRAAARRPGLVATFSHAFGSLLRGLEARRGPATPTLRALRCARRLARMVPTEARQPVGRQHLAPGELELGASRVVSRILPRQPWAELVARRRRNYRRLAEQLADLGCMPLALPAHACPLFAPVWAPQRDAVLAHLARRGIEAVDLWRDGLEPAEDFPDTAELRRHLIEVPCHQDLDDAATDHVAGAVRDAMRAGRSP